MTIVAVVGQSCVIGGKRARVKKFLRSPFVKKPNRGQTTDEENQTDNEPGAPPGVEFSVIDEITFVALGDLLLRASWVGRWRSVVKQRHKRMPKGQHEKKERDRRVHKKPGVQPVVQLCL